MGKRLVYNGPYRYLDAPFPHIACSYGTAIVAGLRLRGHDIEQWNFWHIDEGGTPIDVAYDGVIISEVGQLGLWQQVVPGWDWANKFSLFWLHYVAASHVNFQHLQFVHANCTRVAATCQDVLAAWRHKFGDKLDPFLLEMLPLWTYWSPETASCASPYAESPAYLWAGCCEQRAIEMLLAVTEHLPASRFHIVHAPSGNLDWQVNGVLTPAAAELLRRGVHVHEAMPHGNFPEYYWHAAVGLDCMASISQMTGDVRVNCKAVDYVSAGLPVVGEWRTPGNSLYCNNAWCRQVLPGDWTAYVDAIEELTAMSQNRMQNQQDVRRAFDFELSLDVLSHELQQHGF